MAAKAKAKKTKAVAEKAKPAKAPKATKPAAKKASKKTAKPETTAPAPSLAAMYAGIVDNIDKSLNLRKGNARMLKPISTGLLVPDYVTGGGINSTFTMISGEKASGKTTLSMMGLAASVRANVPLVIMIDAEGTISLDYSESVFQSFDIGDVFENGRARYYNNNIIEDVSAYLAGIVRKLPDKVYLEEEKTWAYAVPKGPNGTEMVARLEKAGLKPDRKLSASGSGKTWYFPTSYDGSEAVVIVDSWAAMIPRSLDETEGDLAGGMAVNARAFSKELPRFVGSLKQKGIAVWSINQLRNDPGVRYGDPLKEKGGEALQFAAGIMCRTYSRAVPQGLVRDKEAYGLEIEPSITKKGGHDRYAWKQFVNTKNKFGRPFLKGYMRVWVADAEGKARGFDPVQDTMEFLSLTGQISGPRKKLKITLRPGVKAPPSLAFLDKRTLTYMEFKLLILAAHMKGNAELVKQSKATFKTDRAPDLRAHLFKQLREDKTLWASQVSDGKSSEEESEAETDE